MWRLVDLGRLTLVVVVFTLSSARSAVPPFLQDMFRLSLTTTALEHYNPTAFRLCTIRPSL